ncbi:MAG: GNAT family N-acetyltransferase [Desulfurococcales archaeon]|nr:GNAT family N-acetyltransferase [Desulfurococcales archaeon]
MEGTRGITIKPANVRYADSIVSLIKSLPEWFTEDAISSVISDIEAMPGYIALFNDKAVGFVLLDERECCLEIAWIAVDRKFHGKGIGSRLLSQVEDYACMREKPILTVKTYGGDDYEPYLKTIEFYKKNGFKMYEVIEEYKPFNGQPAAILVKHLKCATR